MLKGAYHSGNRNEQDPPTSDLINNEQIDHCEQEVCCPNDDGNGDRLVEANKSEKSCGIVHQRVETTKLGNCSR